ncbi:major facilitator superfamily domain-containing protein [Choanephora cucurbitarum]|nr:major facilitator superfamily domain-containing protein [Choanephora cucurbitarum]
MPNSIDSIDRDLFPIPAVVPDSTIQYDTNSKRHSFLSSIPSDELNLTASWRMKLLVLLCMLSLPVGCHFLEATVGTLKTTLKTSMQINNTQFSILLSSVTLVNTVLPLFAGIFIDDIHSLGPIRATTLVSCVIFLGSVLVSAGSSYNSYACMMVGQVVYGLGGGMLVTMQEGILSRWFRDKEITIVIGLSLCVARLTKFIAKLIAYPIMNATGGNELWPIHIATIFCACGAVINVGYWIVMWRKGLATPTGKEIVQYQGRYKNEFGKQEKTKGEDERSYPAYVNRTAKKNFKWSCRVLLYLPSTFWMIPWVQLAMSSVLSSFDDVATEYVEFRYNTSKVMAGYQSSLTQVVPIVVAPIMGIVVHRYGKRLSTLFLATLILITSMVLLAYTWVTPAVGMIVFSFALALGPVSLLSSTSLLLPHELAGTGMGLHKCANNIGTTILSVLVGYVQDLTFHDGDPHDDITDLQTEYDGVMILYVSIAGVAALIVFLFWFLDHKYLSGWLQADKKERDRRLEQVEIKEENEKALYMHADQDELDKVHHEKLEALQLIGSKLRETKSYVYLTIYGFWLIVSWGIFFAFALMPVYQDYM